MSEGFETLGAGASDAMLMRAIEAEHGEARDHHGSARCLNCGTYLTGAYCQSCGQKAHLHRSIHDFWHDFLHGVLHFDGKLWRTLPLLLWHPGELTRRYIHGERARFVSPLALFLFTVFLTFAVFNTLGDKTHIVPDGARATDVVTAKQELEQKITALDRKIEAVRAARQSTAALESERAEAVTAMKVIETMSAFGAQVKPAAKPATKPAAADKSAAATPLSDASTALDQTRTGESFIAHALDKAKNNPDLLLYKLKSYAYKYAWALIPISALWLWLLYAWDRRFLYYDHIIFVTYSIAFMMLFGVFLVLLGTAGIPEGFLWAAFLLFAPVHMYRQLKGAYRGNSLGAMARTVALVAGAVMMLILFLVMLLALGLE